MAMFRKDFQDLALVRVREAEALLAAGLFDGAYYLGGLAVECALKACIAKATQQYEFPDLNRTRRLYSHNLDDLLREAELQDLMRNTDTQIRLEWGKVSTWRIESRYRLGVSESDATEFVRVIAAPQGILSWLIQYW